MNLNVEDFIDDFNRVIDWNFDSNASVRDTLNKWASNKQWLYSKMNDNLIVNSEPIKLSIKKLEEKEEMLQQFIYDAEDRSLLDNHQFEAFRQFCEDYVGGHGFIDNKVTKDFDYEFDQANYERNPYTNVVMVDIHIKKGMRFSKAFKYFFGEDQQMEVKDLQNMYSTFSQKFKGKREGRVYLSIHPLDYLSISTNNHGWQSCHDLADGDYRYGNMNYAADGVTLVAYYMTGEGNDKELRDFGGVRWNSKQWRILVHIKEDASGQMMVVYNRSYPHASCQLVEEVDKLVMQYFDNGKMKELEPFDKYQNSIFVAAESEENCCHYNDIRYENGCYIRMPLSSDDKEFGHYNRFMKTGEPVLCVQCGDNIASDEHDGRCHACKGEATCDLCGRGVYHDDLVYVEDDDIYICEYCYRDKYKMCRECDEVVPVDEAIYNESMERWECHNCVDKRHNNMNDRNTSCLCVIDESKFLIENNLISFDELSTSRTKIRKLSEELIRKESISEAVIVARFSYNLEDGIPAFIESSVFSSYLYTANIDVRRFHLELDNVEVIKAIADSNMDIYNFKNIILTGYARPETLLAKKMQLELLNPSATVTIYDLDKND